MVRRHTLRATAAVVFASSLVLTGCGGSGSSGESGGSGDSTSADKSEPKLEWGPWQKLDAAATVFASSDDLAVLYDAVSQEMRAFNAEGKELWSKSVLVPPTDAGVPGPESYINGETLVYQDPQTGKIHGLNTADGEEQWTFDPGSLGACSAKDYWLITDKPAVESGTITVALSGLGQDALQIAACSGESPAVAGLRLPDGTSGAEDIKPQWKAPALPKSSQVSLPTVDPSGEYLTQVASAPDRRVLQRTALKDGTAQAAVVTRIDGQDINPDAIGNIHRFTAIDADNYALMRETPDLSTTSDIYTVKEWSDVDAAKEPAVTIAADADGADCLTGGVYAAGDKRYCYSATEGGAVFAEVGDNFSGGTLEGVQRKPVSEEFSQGLSGAGLPYKASVGITKDGTLYGLVPIPGNKLQAVSMADGKVFWSAPAEADAGSAARDAGYLPAADAVVFAQDDSAVAVDADTGEELWREGVGSGEDKAGKLSLGWLTTTDSAVAMKIDGGDKRNGQTKFRVMRSKGE